MGCTRTGRHNTGSTIHNEKRNASSRSSEHTETERNVGADGMDQTENPPHLKGGGIPRPLFSVHCGPEGPAVGAKRLHAAEGCEGERSEAVVPETTDLTD